MLGRVSPVTRVTLPACRAHYPGGPQRVHLSVASPPRAAFPEIQAGRRPRRLFRGLLRLHSRYGPSDCSTAQGGLCHEASTRLVAQTGRSSATRSTDNSLGGTFLHWWRAPSGRTERFGLGGASPGSGFAWFAAAATTSAAAGVSTSSSRNDCGLILAWAKRTWANRESPLVSATMRLRSPSVTRAPKTTCRMALGGSGNR
jgi:hypothetical protein